MSCSKACGDCPCSTIPLEAFDRLWADIGERLKKKCIDEETGEISLEKLSEESKAVMEQLKECSPGSVKGDKRFGVPVKSGVEQISSEAWAAIRDFIKEGKWDQRDPVGEGDEKDELLNDPGYGRFMLGFDFHVTESGPKLIEINTNAGGLPTAITLGACNATELSALRDRWLTSLLDEYHLATGKKTPVGVAIVDTDAPSQNLYPEMEYFADILKAAGIPAVVCSPVDLSAHPDTPSLLLASEGDSVSPVDMVYNRLVDFRLTEPEHAVIREGALHGLTVSPHPAAYARVADKRSLLILDDPVVPATFLMSAKPISHWQSNKKKYVFKPADGSGSKGVYRGDKVSNTKLASLPANTLVQEYCPPAVSEDGAKYDVRVYTHGKKILAVATRQFTGQVMEMRSAQSGFRTALPPGACCFSTISL